MKETFIGWKSGKTTYVPLWDRMEGRSCGLSKKSAKSKNRVYSVWGRGGEHNTVYLDDGLKILQNN